MTDYTTITDSQVDPDAPLTSGLAYAWRDNTIAIAEGSLNAPKVVSAALSVKLAFLTLNGTTQSNFTGLDRCADIDFDFSVDPSSTAPLQAAFSNNGGGSWGSFQSISPTLSGLANPVFGAVNMETGAYSTIVNDGTAHSLTTGTLTVPSDANAISFRMNGGIGDQAFGRIRCFGGVTP